MELTVLKEDLHFHLYVKKQPIEIGLSFFFLFLFYSLPVANIGIAICIAQQKVQLNSNFVMETPKKKSKNLKLK
jgi:hypothetical protein